MNTSPRTLVRGSAWAIPTIAASAAAPAFAASQECNLTFVALDPLWYYAEGTFTSNDCWDIPLTLVTAVSLGFAVTNDSTSTMTNIVIDLSAPISGNGLAGTTQFTDIYPVWPATTSDYDATNLFNGGNQFTIVSLDAGATLSFRFDGKITFTSSEATCEGGLLRLQNGFKVDSGACSKVVGGYASYNQVNP